MMRKPIPEAMRNDLSDDPFMRQCIAMKIDGANCEGRIEWNHGMTYGGKRVTEMYAFVPMCHNHHVHEAKWRTLIADTIRERIWHFKAAQDFMAKYPKSTLI